jgi:putative hemolysin
MSSSTILEMVVIFLLILANGFFAASEIAIVSARRGRLQQRADAGNTGARQAVELAAHPERFLATVQIGITLIATFTAAFGGASISASLADWFSGFPVLSPYAEALALGSVVLVISYFSLILGELVPKRLALQSAERVAAFTAPVMTGMSIVTRPVIALLSASVNLVLRLVGQRNSTAPAVTKEDVVDLMHEGIASGTVEAGEKELVQRVFRFSDRPVSAVMTPRSDIIAVKVGTTREEVIQTFVQAGHSRLPLYEDSLDTIIGVLHAKDILQTCLGEEQIDLKQLAREPLFVSEDHYADDLLTTFRHTGIHLAIVLDGDSHFRGLVTLEDVVEELVGEIQSEYQVRDEQAFVQREDGSWLVDGMVAHESVWERIGIPTPSSEKPCNYTTLAELILACLGHIPAVGEVVTIGEVTLEVVDMDGRRIDRVLISRQK